MNNYEIQKINKTQAVHSITKQPQFVTRKNSQTPLKPVISSIYSDIV